jgi:hypothetical protein
MGSTISAGGTGVASETNLAAAPFAFGFSRGAGLESTSLQAHDEKKRDSSIPLLEMVQRSLHCVPQKTRHSGRDDSLGDAAKGAGSE